jgi:hypothetical protein
LKRYRIARKVGGKVLDEVLNVGDDAKSFAKKKPKKTASPAVPNFVHDTVDGIEAGRISQRRNPDGTLDFYEKRKSTPDSVLRKWENSPIYTVEGGDGAYRVVINSYGDIGWLSEHNYNRVYIYQPRTP